MVELVDLTLGYVSVRIIAGAILAVAVGIVVYLTPEFGSVPALLAGILFAGGGEFSLLAIYGLSRR